MKKRAFAIFLSLVLPVACSESSDDEDGDAGLTLAGDAGPSQNGDATGVPTADGGQTSASDGMSSMATDGPRAMGDGSVAPVGPPIKLETLASELGAALCEKVFQCCGDNEVKNLLGTRVKMSNCAALAPATVSQGLVDLVYSVSENRATYHGERVPACVAAFKARSCADFAKILQATTASSSIAMSVPVSLFACPDLLSPKQTPGQLCESNQECIESDCRQDAADKRCRVRSTEMQPCSSTSECVSGLVCSANACRRKAGAGEACFDTTGCGDGLYCAYAMPTAAARTCQPKLDDGQPCPAGMSDACKSNYCQFSSSPMGMSMYKCTAPSVVPVPPVLRCSGR